MSVEAGPIPATTFDGRPVAIVIETRKVDEPCSVCGKPIAPGQLYVPEPVRHFGCRP